MIRTNRKPLHIGIATVKKGGYVITAEYVEGYVILEHFATLDEAEAALPRLRREYLRVTS